jgi:phage terminase large subunit-like protein
MSKKPTGRRADPADADPREILRAIALDPTTPASVRVNACRLLLSSSPEGSRRSDPASPAPDQGSRMAPARRQARWKMKWSLSRLDWQERIRRGESLLPDLPLLNHVEADRAVGLFNRLALPDVHGTPTLEQAGGDWFREIIRAIFGAVDPVTRERHIRGLTLMTPKKNGKTTYSGATMLVALLMNTRPRAEFLLIAPTIAIADLCFQQCVGMIEGAGFLSEDADVRMRVQEHLRTITDLDTGAKLRIKSFDASVLTGTKAAGILVDELQEIAKSPDALRVLGQLTGGMVSSPESFRIYIFTQSDLPPAGVFRSELNAARATRDGKISSDILPVLFEFPPDIASDPAQWQDPKNWWMVTPNRGRSVTIDRLVADWERAQNAGDEETRRWASQHLNVEVGMGLQSDRWDGADYWEARGDKSLTLDALLNRAELVTVGEDRGGFDDLRGLVVVGREPNSAHWLLWSHTWCHAIALERRKSIASRLQDFAAKGELTIVSQPGDDTRQIADLIKRIDGTGKLPAKGIGVDQHGDNEALRHELSLRGIPDARLAGIAQGYQLNSSIRTLERRLAEGGVTHAAQDLMAWAVSNAKIEARGNAVLITKQAAGSAKIDTLRASTPCA